MIKAIGTDIVEIDRFHSALQRWGDRFIKRILTDDEIQYCLKKANHVESMAARFAAKEAVIKCLLPADQQEFKWHDVQVLNHSSGKPYIIVLNRLADSLQNCDILVSLSHSEKSAVAVVLLQAKYGEANESDSHC